MAVKLLESGDIALFLAKNTVVIVKQRDFDDNGGVFEDSAVVCAIG